MEYEKKKYTGDASGRGSSPGFKVNFPARMKPYSEDQIAIVSEVMRNAEVQTQGKYLQQFEEDFAEYLGSPHAFGVDNATNALHLAAILCRVGPGDEVIIPGYTFCATAIPFGATGASIVWADIDPKTWVLDPADVLRKITPRTKALVAVHLLGMPVDMPAIMEIARQHKVKVVEDCAQAPGAAIYGKKVGSFGDFGCFSFHAAKNMTTLGEGGMLTVSSDEDAALVPGLRHNGIRPFPTVRERYWVPAMSNVDIDLEGVWPNNFSLGEVQSALGSLLLKNLDETNVILNRQALRLRELVSDIPELSVPDYPEAYNHAYHQFVMHYDGTGSGTTRNDLLDYLTSKAGIRAIVQYYPLYRYPLFQKLDAGNYNCPVIEAWWDNSFSIPWWVGMDDETLQYIVDSLRAGVQLLRVSTSGQEEGE
jgi:perosamine synthetase